MWTMWLGTRASLCPTVLIRRDRTTNPVALRPCTTPRRSAWGSSHNLHKLGNCILSAVPEGKSLNDSIDAVADFHARLSGRLTRCVCGYKSLALDTDRHHYGTHLSRPDRTSRCNSVVLVEGPPLPRCTQRHRQPSGPAGTIVPLWYVLAPSRSFCPSPPDIDASQVTRSSLGIDKVGPSIMSSWRSTEELLVSKRSSG